MLIQVTKEIIDNSVRQNPFLCPVAKALHKATGHNYSVSKDFIYNNCYRKVVKIPKAVTKWIKAYDRKKEVKPFEFQINI